MPLRAALKAMADAVSNASKNKTTITSNKPINTSSSNKKDSTSNTSKTSNSSNSYAYDPKGNKVNVTIKDGQSYLDDGNRVGTGYTVQTGGGIYKMGNDGKGIKVDSHNTSNNSYVNTLVNSLGSNKEYNNVNAKPDKLDKGDTTSKNIYKSPIVDYTNKYNDSLMNIYNNGNNYDNSVLRSMFTSDIQNANNTDPNYKRYGTFDITPDMVSGYDTAYQDLITGMTKKYDSFDDNKKQSVEGRIYQDAINGVGNTNQSTSQNKEVNNGLINALSNTPIANANNNIPISNNAPYNNAVQFIPLDDSNPDIGGIFDTPQGYYMEYEGERVPLSDEEYIELMETILGF